MLKAGLRSLISGFGEFAVLSCFFLCRFMDFIDFLSFFSFILIIQWSSLLLRQLLFFRLK